MKNSEQFSETPVEEVTPEVVPTDTIQEAAEPTTAAPVEEEA